MAILEILRYPDPRLRTVAKPVTEIGDDIHRQVADMFETMYEASGIGLAATQVNIHQRMLVMDVTEEHDEPLVLINPEIVEVKGWETMDEGCLSVPGVAESVSRAEWVRVRALDEYGESFEIEADGLKAVCIQHEIDHLDGKLFVDYLSNLKRQRIRKKLEKEIKGKSGKDDKAHSKSLI